MIQVTAAIIIRNGKTLIAKRKPTARLADLWEFPGGKIESGETPEQCLKRELHEEFEIHVQIGELLGTNVHEYDFGTIELMAFKTYLISGEFKLNDHAEMAWVSADEIEDFAFTPADLPFVAMVRRREIEF